MYIFIYLYIYIDIDMYMYIYIYIFLVASMFIRRKKIVSGLQERQTRDLVYR